MAQDKNAKNAYYKQLRQRRLDSGLCGKCGYAKTSTEHERCYDWEKLRRKKALQDGMCRTHVTRPAISRHECEECWLRAMSKAALGDRKEWETIKQLLAKQNNLCAYTGKVLIPAINASVDHKIPRTRGGLLVSANIHFVDKAVNKLKTWLTHDEFLLICKTSWEKPLNDPTSQLLAQIYCHVNGLKTFPA